MKRLPLLVCAFALLPQSAAAQSSAADSAGIRRAALDYIEGWWTADSARMARALHPDLAKRATRRDENAESRLAHTGADELIRSTGAGRGSRLPPEQRRSEVEILDVYGDIATVRLASTRLMDYLHLLRWNGEWKIVNVLWAPRSTRAELGLPLFDLPLDAEGIARYRGIYSLGSGTEAREVRVFAEDGQLKAQIGPRPFRLLYQGENTFILAMSDDMRIVFTLENGRASGFDLHDGTRTVPARRRS